MDPPQLGRVGEAATPSSSSRLPDDGDIPTVFAVYVRLSDKGRVQEALDARRGPRGSTSSAAATKFAASARDGYWIQLNMAADL
ncbi:MAG: hypothetical protein U0599_29680 [Vicinamibacteria bacterium]